MTKETFDTLTQLCIHPQIKKVGINQTEPTFIDITYDDFTAKVHKDASINDILSTLIYSIATNAQHQGIIRGKELFKEELKTLLGI